MRRRKSRLLGELSSKFTQKNLIRILLSCLHKTENYKLPINKGIIRCSHIPFGSRLNTGPFEFLLSGSGFEF